jgi:Protein of unknown function (DUF2591)
VKVKVSEATRAQINWLVAKCSDLLDERGRYREEYCDSLRHDAGDFTDDWLQAGPIIERENIGLVCQHSESTQRCAYRQTDKGEVFYHYGETILIAAMRCYIEKELGEEAEVPKSLLTHWQSPDVDTQEYQQRPRG